MMEGRTQTPDAPTESQGLTSSPPRLEGPSPMDIGGKLWLYVNFDCNLRCSY
jgi:hypothetical protein